MDILTHKIHTNELKAKYKWDTVGLYGCLHGDKPFKCCFDPSTECETLWNWDSSCFYIIFSPETEIALFVNKSPNVFYTSAKNKKK